MKRPKQFIYEYAASNREPPLLFGLSRTQRATIIAHSEGSGLNKVRLINISQLLRGRIIRQRQKHPRYWPEGRKPDGKTMAGQGLQTKTGNEETENN